MEHTNNTRIKQDDAPGGIKCALTANKLAFDLRDSFKGKRKVCIKAELLVYGGKSGSTPGRERVQC